MIRTLSGTRLVDVHLKMEGFDVTLFFYNIDSPHVACWHALGSEVNLWHVAIMLGHSWVRRSPGSVKSRTHNDLLIGWLKSLFSSFCIIIYHSIDNTIVLRIIFEDISFANRNRRCVSVCKQIFILLLIL